MTARAQLAVMRSSDAVLGMMSLINVACTSCAKALSSGFEVVPITTLCVRRWLIIRRDLRSFSISSSDRKATAGGGALSSMANAQFASRNWVSGKNL